MIYRRLISEIQESYFNEKNDRRFVTLENDYLNQLYEAKNREVYTALENEFHLKEMLTAENETDLEMETWMTSQNVWEMISNSNKNVDEYLDKMLTAKSEEVYKSIRTAKLLNEAMASVKEDALALDPWMTNNTVSISNEFSIPENQYLAKLLAEKNEALIASLELQCKCKQFLAMEEKDEPLEMEDWMTDAKCWCPENVNKNHSYTEPFAMKNE